SVGEAAQKRPGGEPRCDRARKEGMSMAQLTTDFKAALDYIAQAKRKQCLVPDEHLPEPWWTNPDIPYLGVGLSGDYRRFLQTGQWPAEYQVYATGWDSL